MHMEEFFNTAHSDRHEEEFAQNVLQKHLDEHGNPVLEQDYPEITNAFKNNEEHIAITEKINELKKLVPLKKEMQFEIDAMIKELEERRKDLIEQSNLYTDQQRNFRHN